MKQYEIFVAVIAILAGLWSHVKAVAAWLRGFVIQRATSFDSEFSAMIIAYLSQDKAAVSREPRYGVVNRYVLPRRQRMSVIMQRFYDSPSVWLSWKNRPIHYGFQQHSDVTSPYVFEWLRGTIDWSELTKLAVEWWSSGNRSGNGIGRFQIIYHQGRDIVNDMSQKGKSTPDTGAESEYDRDWHCYFHWRPEDIGFRPEGGLETLALASELHDAVSEIRLWLNSKSWYEHRAIAWRRGYLAKGGPGTGKTSFIRALAIDLDLPVHVFDLAGMSNDDLRKEWKEMLSESGESCIAVIEDIDAVFKGRDNVSKTGGMFQSGGLTFDCLLNCLDGLERSTGVILFVTTNHPEYVDSALLDRPGRIDRVLHFKPPDLEASLTIARRILGDVPSAARIAEQHVGSAAKLVEACCREALEQLYKSEQPFR